MKELLAIVSGIIFIAIAILVLQLAYLFVAIGYSYLAEIFLFLNDIDFVFRYLIAFPIYIATMFVGGYITASIANEKSNIKIALYCLIVGLITVGGMMYSALENTEITLTGIVVSLLALVATPAGGFYWLRRARKTDTHQSN